MSDLLTRAALITECCSVYLEAGEKREKKIESTALNEEVVHRAVRKLNAVAQQHAGRVTPVLCVENRFQGAALPMHESLDRVFEALREAHVRNDKNNMTVFPALRIYAFGTDSANPTLRHGRNDMGQALKFNDFLRENKRPTRGKVVDAFNEFDAYQDFELAAARNRRQASDLSSQWHAFFAKWERPGSMPFLSHRGYRIYAVNVGARNGSVARIYIEYFALLIQALFEMKLPFFDTNQSSWRATRDCGHCRSESTGSFQPR